MMPALRACFRSSHSNSLFHTTSAQIDPSLSLLKLLDLSIDTQSHNLTSQSHARAHRLGLTQHSLIAQKLIFSYCQFRCPFEGQSVFDSLFFKNTHLCNTLLSGYGKNRMFEESLCLFREMCRGSDFGAVDDFTFSVIFKIAGEFGDVLVGKMVHSRSLKSALVFDTVVGNSLMSMYEKFGCFGDAFKVFDEMPLRNVSSWNALISSYSKGGWSSSVCGLGIWDIVREMQSQGFKFDAFTVSMLLSLCGEEGGHGRELHCYIVRNGLNSSCVHIGCGLIAMYSKNGGVDLGRRVFDRMECRNVYAWTAIINGYANCGKFDDALFLFRGMQCGEDDNGPNKVSLVAILPACSSIAGLIGGKQIHGFAVRRGVNHDLSLCNTLIDMYSKCGSLSYASKVFEHECTQKDAISWCSMICGYGLHCQGENSVTLFDRMLQNGLIKPDTSLVVGVLSACSKSGLIRDGLRIYDYVVAKCKIIPSVEICACMVDMLGKSGQLDEALDFIKNMNVDPSPSIWGALLSASALHGNSEMQELAYKSLIMMEPDNSSNYISLSNLYASSKRWDVVAEVRQVMRKRGLRKVPGCSWISMNGAAHSFVVADKSHPCSTSLYAMLDELVSSMKLSCYNLDFLHLTEV
ncbi:pentatricopeptide repeat-containing protein At1g06140, mitochondrial-like [Salvia splendens]|uniref:pentatricopeptide repeat-containing protein At1g06140, mitochondrial-like n=1 Tax=Salvia splendens TaxID=180675 RepID=UPI001C270658|nr:pentatricopeptide repeat-containing protein At1g06140, mitochondrial-like [Salvia splendens]